MPGLLRRSLRRSLRWRVLLLWWVTLLVPSAIATAPAFVFLREQLDHSTRAQDAVPWMDGAVLIDLVRRLSEHGNAASLLLGLGAGALALFAIAPLATGAMVAAAAEDVPLPFPRLLAAAGGMYGRMLRTALLGLVPLGAAAALAAVVGRIALRASERVASETAANRSLLLATAVASALLFLAHLLTDGARAQFAVHPERRSAVGAFLAAARLMRRRPLRFLAVGALGAAVGLGGAGALLALRLRIPQQGPASLALAWLLAQGAQWAVGWGRAARIDGIAELSRADAADLALGGPGSRPAAAGPQTEVVQSATLSALEPPRSGAPR